MKPNDLRPVPLSAVELTDPYLRNAEQKTREYLLSLETGRLLSGFYENAGIPTPYVRYGGWENSLIGGHTLGHYLSALSQAYATGGGAPFKERIDVVCEALLQCRDAVGSGLVWGALPVGGIEAQFDHVEEGKTDIKREAWVPWYTLHKLLSGLLDADSLAGSRAARSLAEGLGDWTAARSEKWDERTRHRVLSVEYGGMNEALYRLFRITGDPRHLQAARRFDEEPLFDEILSEKPDVLNGKHANTTIPKVLGALMRYSVGGETRYLKVAETFFKTVAEKHTYTTGGNSEWEHFGRDGILDAERTNCNCETCNVYNMLKLARGLYCATGDLRYPDFYDNAFTNSILSSQNPETGMTTYFQPMAGGFFKVFSRPYDRFWCCTGSGMENFTKLGDGIFYTCEEGLVVARYEACRLRLPSCEVALDCGFPLRDRAKIRILSGKPFRLFLRVPDWRAADPVLLREGRPFGTLANGYLAADVRGGEELELTIPVGVTLDGLPDSRETFAFRYGGVALSADLGTEAMEETTTGVDVTIPRKRIMESESVYFKDLSDVLRDPGAYLVREGDGFRLKGGDRSYSFGLHYRRYRERYALYFRLREGERREETLQREPYDVVQPGYGQYETDELHDMREKNSVGVTSDGTYRFAKAGGYFCYDMRIDPAKTNTLQIFLLRSDNGRPLQVTVGGEVLFDETLLYTMGEERYTREIAIPPETAARFVRKRADGEEVTVISVRFEGKGRRQSAKVCEFVRMFSE